MNDLISVIVPVYRVEAYLDACIVSILAQTHRELELLLVDDGSPDSCPARCDAWAEVDSRIRVIHKENGGLSDARNAGLREARGAYIGFVDSDDEIAPQMYEKLLAALQHDGSDIAACGVTMFWEDGRAEQQLTVSTNRVLSRSDAQLALLRGDLLKQPVWYKLYRRETADIPFAVGKYHEDVFWSYQAVARAQKVSIIDYPGYRYRQRSGSIMSESFSLKRLDGLEALLHRYAFFRTEFPELAAEARYAIRTSCIYNGQLALQSPSAEVRREAMARLKATQKQYPIRWKETAGKKLTHRLWLRMSDVSLTAVCRLKNRLKIGV